MDNCYHYLVECYELYLYRINFTKIYFWFFLISTYYRNYFIYTYFELTCLNPYQSLIFRVKSLV